MWNKDDLPVIVGLVSITAISIVAMVESQDTGMQVASAAVGGICGWFAAKRGGQTANVAHADNVQTSAPIEPTQEATK